MNILKSHIIPLEREIEKFEKEKGIVIPSAFKKLLYKYNLIYLDETIFYKGDDVFYIDRFYPFGDDIDNSIQSSYNNLNSYFQNEFLAFANDPGDWQYVISLRDKDYGQIYLCRMDDIIPDALIYLAKNIDAFLSELRKEEIN